MRNGRRFALICATVASCGGADIGSDAGDATAPTDAVAECKGPFCGLEAGGAGPCYPPTPCTNLCLQQVCCDGGTQTSISGVVYAPNGDLPLYNAIVYVPNAPLSPLAHGAVCDFACDGLDITAPLAIAPTDIEGRFTLRDVPAGSNVPVVVQVGKWRRRFTVPFVTACVDNPLPDKAARLATEPLETSPDDDVPHIAVGTGAEDALECLLAKLGVAQSQFTPPSGSGRVHLYPGPSFWPNAGDAGIGALSGYDMVLLACEGGTFPSEKPLAALAALESYANMGGYVFATHDQYYWIENGPAPWPGIAAWNHAADPPTGELNVAMNLPKSVALAHWMLANGGSTTYGSFTASRVHHDVDSADASVFVTADDDASPTMFVRNTPTTNACGRIVFADLDISASTDAGAFPAKCTPGPLTPEEKAFAFLLFDRLSCVSN